MLKNLTYNEKRFYITDGTFTINRYIEPVKEESSPHTHDCVEISYVCSGSGYHLVDGKEYRVYKGDLFILNYDMSHTFYSISEDSPVITYNIMFKPGFLDELLLDFNNFNSLTMSFLFRSIWREDSIGEDLRLSTEEQQDFDQLISNIYREYTIEPAGFRDIIRAYMVELIIKIMRCFNSRAEKNNSVKSKASIIDSILIHLHENYNKAYSLNEIALKSFFSKNYICKLFKNATGTTIGDYVQSLRIEEACKLLEVSGKKITDIGYEVGFSDYKSFNSLFKKVKGMLPKEYRAMHRM